MQGTKFFLLEKKDLNFSIIKRIQPKHKNEKAVQGAK